MAFVDRVSQYPGRIKLTDAQGNEAYYTMERADEPTVEGTALNARNLNTLAVKTEVTSEIRTAVAGYVPTSRTVAGHALTGDVTVSRSDVGLGNVTNNKQMPIAGGTFTGNAVAYSTNRTTAGLRNIEVRITSATGTLQSTNRIIMVRK